MLIYENASSSAAMLVANPGLQKTLRQVGYRVSTCTQLTECEKAASGGKIDILLADIADANSFRGAGTGTSSKLALVPLLLKPSKLELSDAKTAFGQAFDASSGDLRLLEVLAKASRRVR